MKKKNSTQEKLTHYVKQTKSLSLKVTPNSDGNYSKMLMSGLPIAGLFFLATPNTSAATLTGNTTSTAGSIKKGNFGNAVLFDSDPGNFWVTHLFIINGENFQAKVHGNGAAAFNLVANGGPGSGLITKTVGNNYLKKLNSGDAIAPAFGGEASMTSSGNGPWGGMSPVTGYIGFEFDSGEEGWVRVTFEGELSNGSNRKLTLHEFAFATNTTLEMVAGQTSTVPIDLFSFSAQSTPIKIKLHWETASETNNAGFELQRSENGKNFRTLQFIEGKGTTYEHQEYFYDDKDLRKGRTYYYRLRQIDFDGNFSDSEIITAHLEDMGVSGTFSPNPVIAGQTRLDFNAVESGELHLLIFDVGGKSLLTQTYLVEEGSNTLELDLSQLGTGLFFIKMKQGVFSRYEQLVIE